MGESDQIAVQATATSVAVVEELHRREEAGVTELAEALDVSKSAIHNHLSTLQTLGYVAGSEGRYRLTHRFLRIGLATRERNPVYRAAREEVLALARNTGAIANLVVPEGGFGVYLQRVGDGDHPIPTGGRVQLHAAAAGKAILAFRPPEEVDAYVSEHGLEALTDRTVTDASTLRGQLRSIRDRRIAFDRGELDAEWQCVASPVVVGDRAAAAISVSGPAEAMQGKRLEEDTAGLVSSAAKAIELELL